MESPPTPVEEGGSPRGRVVISAYACGPLDEPEAGAGWAYAVAAALHHEVWVVTRPRFRPAIEAAFRRDPGLSDRLHVEYLDPPRVFIRLRRRSWDLYWFYIIWQFLLARRVRTLHRRHHFDVGHHVTFANDWLPCGLSRVRDLSMVWGPVGGATNLPYWRMRRWLGLRGFVNELVRVPLTGVPRRIWGDAVARRASVVVAQNGDVADRFAHARRVVIEPNAALEEAVAAEPNQARERRTALFVGRLIGLKGGRLALATIAHPAAREWRLRIYGEGYDRDRLEQLASDLLVRDRVEFLGHRPRPEVLAAYRTAGALLFPSMHDQAGWAAAEASAAGCPVVCLPLGGPPILAGDNAFVASLDGDVVANLAQQLNEAGEKGGAPYNRWSRDRLSTLVDDWYADAMGTRRP